MYRIAMPSALVRLDRDISRFFACGSLKNIGLTRVKRFAAPSTNAQLVGNEGPGMFLHGLQSGRVRNLAAAILEL